MISSSSERAGQAPAEQDRRRPGAGSSRSTSEEADRLTATAERRGRRSRQRLTWSSDCSRTAVVRSRIRPDVLGQRQERVGQQQAAGRVVPAHQRLDAGDLEGPRVDLGLVVHDEAAG